MDREIWRGKDVGYIVKKKMNRSCRKNGMVSVNRWGFGSVNRAVKKGEGKEMDQEIKQRIETLKKEKDVVILAHYYVDGEVQEIADYVGDSYYLAELATTVPQKTIIFCGVSFMGESAKILSPEKTVIMADRSADCPMAHMVEVEKIREVRKEYPGCSRCLLCELDGGDQGRIGCLCYLIECTQNREKTAEQGYFLYSG